MTQDRVKLEIEIPASWIERFTAVKAPEGLCGPSIEEKIAFLVGEGLDGYEHAVEVGRSMRLYRALGLKHPHYDEDDDIDL